ncbi:MAG: dephospho-CoA kinase [Gammaproteobacteria bacterium 28-57-27]|nr:MAG: dephospho-CoA kinase [Gammaproteobacteria bacterium 28-57-27]
MLTIGLTGGIASGKSTVCKHFAALGVPIVDTDLIARELVQPGQPALAEIITHFGRQALHDDGQLNRPWLRQRIFSSDQERNTLNAILHPRIRAEARARLEALDGMPAPYALLVVPLLLESGEYAPLIDRVLVVDLDVDTQLERLMQRDGMDLAQAQAILRAQATRAQRLAHADDIIDNSGSNENLRAAVIHLHQDYVQRADQLWTTPPPPL